MGDVFAELSPPYATIVADPPWRYENQRGTQTRARRGRAAATANGNYSTMSIAEVAALPVADLAAKDAHLYLWITTPLIFGDGRNSLTDVLSAWGFTYRTLVTWVKTGPPGMGFTFRGHTEHAIFAMRGNAPIPPGRRRQNVITAPRRGHSEKPDAFLELVEDVSPGPYVELFCRRPRLGWDSWGYGYELKQEPI